MPDVLLEELVVEELDVEVPDVFVVELPDVEDEVPVCVVDGVRVVTGGFEADGNNEPVDELNCGKKKLQ